MERCELSDLPVDQCGCRKHPKGRAYDARQAREGLTGPAGTPGETGTAITARYPGVCPECGEPFAPGDTIRPRSYGGSGNTPFKRWIHNHCAE